MVSPHAEPNRQELERAMDEFAYLLGSDTLEAAWQVFFAKNRFVLSRSLPLRLLPCDITPLGRPGHSEPDFILYPGSDRSEKLHGVIELKRHNSKVIRRLRRNILALSGDAETAIRQVLKYEQQYEDFAPGRRTLTFQTMSYLFVIMGLTSELSSIEDSLHEDLKRVLPPSVRFLGYDEIFDNYRRGLPRRALLLTPYSVEAATVRPFAASPRPYGRIVACCWAIGEPGTREFRFCDLPSEPGRPYCEGHVKIAYERIRDRREDAALI